MVVLKNLYLEEIVDSWVDENESEEKTNERFKKLSEIVDPMYDFILTYSNYYSSRRDYGVGEKLTMLEVHYLTDIYDNPGITVTEISKIWNRSKSAISQTVRKLINWEYICKKENTEDGKVYNLYITDIGKEIVMAHKRYDNVDIVKTRKRLLRDFTVDELVAFDEICKAYTALLRNKDDK